MFDPVAYINEPRWRSMSLGLERIEELLAKLGNPQDNLRFVHVAGTNGKGSTCSFISSILKESGYKVGLFTSPYIERFEERIRINGENISLQRLSEVTLRVKDAAEVMASHPTEFELMTAVAFTYFAEEKCDIVVAEVGLGGRLDSTNVIRTVEVCVFAPISYDHCALLGSTLYQIAGEKAGILKSGKRIVVQRLFATSMLRLLRATPLISRMVSSIICLLSCKDRSSASMQRLLWKRARCLPSVAGASASKRCEEACLALHGRVVLSFCVITPTFL